MGPLILNLNTGGGEWSTLDPPPLPLTPTKWDLNYFSVSYLNHPSLGAFLIA